MLETTEKPTVAIPESITLNGVTYSVKDTPELQKFIQEIAKVEKSKLYSQFESLRSQINNLGRVRVEGSFGSVDEIVEKLSSTFVTKNDLQQMLPEVVKEAVRPIVETNEQNRLNELENYRQKLIKENIAVCIPDLVTGDSKEALDAALQRSIELRAKYPTPSSAPFEGKPVKDPLIAHQASRMDAEAAQTPTPAAPAFVPPVTPVPEIPRRQSPEVSGPSNVKRMSMAEFEKNRDSLREQLEAVYGNGTL